MSVHSNGTGTGWNTTLDINQPHGLDYLEWQDIRKGINKRIGQEHSPYADATVGGIHTPGGTAILGIEDGTATIVADGTLKGHGMVWDGTGRIFCSTAVAGASTTGDFTVILIHPDKQWAGQDVTWTGAHEFDGSVDISGVLNVDSSSEFQDSIKVFGAADISGAMNAVGINSDASSRITGTLQCVSNAEFNGNIEVDGTASQFGGTNGIGLFYDPTIYIGGETCSIGNGMIMKFGVEAGVTANTTVDVSYATAFPNGGIVAMGSFHLSNSSLANPATADGSTTGVAVTNGSASARDIAWFAIGY